MRVSGLVTWCLTTWNMSRPGLGISSSLPGDWQVVLTQLYQESKTLAEEGHETAAGEPQLPNPRPVTSPLGS